MGNFSVMVVIDSSLGLVTWIELVLMMAILL